MYFDFIVKRAGLEQSEISTWELIYHGLCAWQLVAANKMYFGPKYKLSAIEKLINAGVITYQEENGFGMSAFCRGENWPARQEYDTTPVMPKMTNLTTFEEGDNSEKRKCHD